MKQTFLTVLVAVFLTAGTLFYTNSPYDNSLESTFNEWKSEFKIGLEFNDA